MLLSLVSRLLSLVSCLVSRLYQEILTNWRKAIDQNSRLASNDAVPDIWRNIIAAPGGQAGRLYAIHDQIDLAGDDIADLLVRMAVDRSSNTRVEHELHQHHPAAIAQDTALCALRRLEGWFVGCISQEFHNAIPYNAPGTICNLQSAIALGCFDRGYNVKGGRHYSKRSTRCQHVI
jgi:hypothetical protein